MKIVLIYVSESEDLANFVNLLEPFPTRQTYCRLMFTVSYALALGYTMTNWSAVLLADILQS